jgi:trehalose 6-phosphate synthase
MTTMRLDYSQNRQARWPPPAALRGRSLIVVANRGPAEFIAQQDGSFASRPGAGGLVTALAGSLHALRDVDVTWVAVAMTEGDRAAFAGEDVVREVQMAGRNIGVKYVTVPPEVYRLHYGVISNEVLWFFQHYMVSPEEMAPFDDRHKRAWEQGYEVVNRALAEAAVVEARRLQRRDSRPPLILVQDYQLYLVPGMVRALLPEALLNDFVHIPWPALRYWLFLPHKELLAIYESLIHTDLLGFQTRQDCVNFVETAGALLDGATVSADHGEVTWNEYHVQVGVYPATVDAEAACRSARQAAELESGAWHRAHPGVKTIVRVDRLEPTKNIYRGFLSYRQLLKEHPVLRGRVVFRAFLVPSRQDIAQYQSNRQRILRLVRDLNRRYGNPGWMPIDLVQGNDRPRALAALRAADVMLVNPLEDGMNLVAKEAVIVNDCDGVLVLSRNAGAFRELQDACLPVTPTDVGETAEQLYQALRMSRDKRHALAAAAREAIKGWSPADWLLDQITDTLHAHARAERRHKRSSESRRTA